MLAPIEKSVTTSTPGGLNASVQGTRTATLATPGNPFSLSLLTETANINGRTYSSVYNGATHVITDTTPVGRQSFTTLDMQERPIQTRVTGLLPVNLSYDSRGRVRLVTQGSGAETRSMVFTYDANGYLATATDPLSRTVSFGYDLAGRATSQTLPDSRVINYAYDANGNLTALTPPGRPAHGFIYTAVDQVETYTPPDVVPGTDTRQYAYNLDRQLELITRPDGLTVDPAYDSAGRLSTLTIARGAITYGYNGATGNLASISAPGGLGLAYTFDGSLLKSETWSGAVTGAVTRTYDNNFRLTSLGVNGSPIALGYDTDSLLTQAGGLTLTRHPQHGLLTGSTLGSISDSHAYNGFGEPISYTARFGGTSLLGYQYTHDKLGRITTRTETLSGVTDVYSYTYDLAGRLKDVARNGVVQSTYTYDANGNRLTHTSGGNTVNGAYDNQDRLQAYGPNTYTYTANGELLTKTNGGQTTTYQYDELGNLTHVGLPDGTQIDYLIDGANRRIGKKINGVLTQGFLYDGQLRIVAELDASNTVVSRFVYATHINIPDYMVKGGITYRILTDHLGSPRLVVNTSTGVVAQAMSYDEFGRVLADTNPGFQPFGFAGGLYDLHTGLVRFGARDYDTETGRWTTKDPIRFDGGDTNLYGYVLNDPLNLQDIAGLTVSCTYSQSSGRLVCTDDQTGQPVVDQTGYSGHGAGLNNPALKVNAT